MRTLGLVVSLSALLSIETTASAEVIALESYAIVRLAPADAGPGGPSPVRVRVRVMGDHGRQPKAVRLSVASGIGEQGSPVFWQDDIPTETVTIASPGEHEFVLDKLDNAHCKWIVASASGYSTASVVLASGGVEVDFILVPKRPQQK